MRLQLFCVNDSNDKQNMYFCLCADLEWEYLPNPTDIQLKNSSKCINLRRNYDFCM